MRKLIPLVLISILLLSITACNKTEKEVINNFSQTISNKPMSWGKDHVIYIFADQEMWQEVEVDVKANLQRVFETTNEETLFDIKLADVNKIDDYYKFRNLLFLADITDNEPVAKYVTEQLQGDLIDQANKDGYAFLYKENLWARDQVVCFLLANSSEQMKSLHINLKDVLFDKYSDALKNRISNRISSKVTKDEKIFSTLPYIIDIPKQFTVFRDEKEQNILSFLYRHYKQQGDKPDKYVTVYYEKSDKNPINEQWLIKTRGKIGWDIYDNDEIKADQVKIEPFAWKNRKGTKLHGRWSNYKHYVGGAFQSFAFYDEKTKTAYLIDNSIFFPAGDKLYYLMELEAISKSIQIK
ncbi:MAG: DUF4837 family protein [Candidatus Zophobacter franzmannii]|nr:DUF4837 family protein [Candidatus Zophobacter franzmannii]